MKTTRGADYFEDVKAMCDIISDDASTDDETQMALLTLIDLIDPSLLDTQEVRREMAEWDKAQGIKPSTLDFAHPAMMTEKEGEEEK
jgi:hypothetical protein